MRVGHRGRERGRRVEEGEETYVDQKRQVRRVSPEAHLRELVEEKLLRLEEFGAFELGVEGEGFREARRELEDGVARAGEGFALCRSGRGGMEQG